MRACPPNNAPSVGASFSTHLISERNIARCRVPAESFGGGIVAARRFTVTARGERCAFCGHLSAGPQCLHGLWRLPVQVDSSQGLRGCGFFCPQWRKSSVISTTVGHVRVRLALVLSSYVSLVKRNRPSQGRSFGTSLFWRGGEV